MIQKVPSGLSVGDYRRNGLRHFIGHRGCEPSHCCDAVDVRWIDLRFAQGFGGKRQGVRSDLCGKFFFSIVRRGAEMSGVDHSAFLCTFGAEHKTAKVYQIGGQHPTNDQAPLGGI